MAGGIISVAKNAGKILQAAQIASALFEKHGPKLSNLNKRLADKRESVQEYMSKLKKAKSRGIGRLLSTVTSDIADKAGEFTEYASSGDLFKDLVSGAKDAGSLLELAELASGKDYGSSSVKEGVKFISGETPEKPKLPKDIVEIDGKLYHLGKKGKLSRVRLVGDTLTEDEFEPVGETTADKPKLPSEYEVGITPPDKPPSEYEVGIIPPAKPLSEYEAGIIPPARPLTAKPLSEYEVGITSPGKPLSEYEVGIIQPFKPKPKPKPKPLTEYEIGITPPEKETLVEVSPGFFILKEDDDDGKVPSMKDAAEATVEAMLIGAGRDFNWDAHWDTIQADRIASWDALKATIDTSWGDIHPYSKVRLRDQAGRFAKSAKESLEMDQF